MCRENCHTAPEHVQKLLIYNMINEHETRESNWDELLERGRASKPTDDVTLSFKATQWLNERWLKAKAGSPVPADIFYERKIPLPIVTIHIEMPTEKYPKFALKSKVVIFEDALEDLVPGEEKIIGVCSLGADIYSKENWFILRTDSEGGTIIEMSKSTMERLQKTGDPNFGFDLISRCICAWYGVQIALLHPTLKYVFSHPHMAPLFSERKHNKKKRKTGYIKKHKISEETLDETLFPENTANSRHVITCPVWWVIGHWHTYSGEKKWVKGYWKGILRDAKQNLDEGRDRENICVQ